MRRHSTRMIARLFLSLWFIWIIAICSTNVTGRSKEFAFDAGSNNLIECEMSNMSTIIVWQLSLPSQDEATALQIIPIYNGRSKVKSDFSNLFDIQTVEKSGQWISVVTLLNVQSLHAGLYACLDAADDAIKQFFNVTVVVSKPHCSANFSSSQSAVQEFDSMQVTCNVSYVGNLLPMFRCQPSAAQLPQQFIHTTLIHHELNRSNVTKSIVTFTHVHVINVSRDVGEIPLTCSMEFTQGNTSDVQPPAYNFTWNYYIATWSSVEPDTIVITDRITISPSVSTDPDRSTVIVVVTVVFATIAFIAVLVMFFITVCYTRRRRQLRSNKPDVLTSHYADIRHNDDDFTQTDLYAEVTVGRRRDPTVRPPPVAQAIYASIDHTATIR